MIDDEDFRNRVLEVARELFPAITFMVPPDAEGVILAGEHELGLQNIRAKYALSESPDDELPEIVRGHLSLLLDEFTFPEIAAKLFPQIMPANFAANPDLPLVSYPLGSGTCIGIVADFPPRRDLRLRHPEPRFPHLLARRRRSHLPPEPRREDRRRPRRASLSPLTARLRPVSEGNIREQSQ